MLFRLLFVFEDIEDEFDEKPEDMDDWFPFVRRGVVSLVG